MKQQVCAGIRIDAHRENTMSISSEFYYRNEPPLVTLRQIGGTTITLTPNEARTVAAMLGAAADVAEGK